MVFVIFFLSFFFFLFVLFFLCLFFFIELGREVSRSFAINPAHHTHLVFLGRLVVDAVAEGVHLGWGAGAAELVPDAHEAVAHSHGAGGLGHTSGCR